jgi:hypothetical protein
MPSEVPRTRSGRRSTRRTSVAKSVFAGRSRQRGCGVGRSVRPRLCAVIAVAVAGLVCSANSVLADLLWQPYADPVLGYSVLYPSGLFDRPAVQEHGGITLSASTGATLFIFGGPNREGRSTGIAADQLSGASDVYQVTYRKLTGTWLVLSGYLTNGSGRAPQSIFYERIAFSPDRLTLAGFRLVYSPIQRPIFDPIIATIGNSLRPPVAGIASLAVRPPELGPAGPSPTLSHEEWCRRKYSSYNPATGSFLRFDGQYVPCVSPAG